MKIQVTAEDIAKGTRVNCYDCPVARAIARALPDIRPSVGSFTISAWKFGGVVSTIDTPQEVTDFVEAFDDCRPVSPFEFELPVTTFAEVSK